MRGIAALLCALALAEADPVRTNIASYDETDPKQAPIICATDNSNSILVAHENCNQFYQCWDGIPIARNCYGKLHYNPIAQICDWPDNVDCGGRIICQELSSNENNSEVSEQENPSASGAGNCDPSQAGPICAQEKSNGIFVAHENCNKYYICDHGVPVVKRCPGTLLFDPFKDYCDWPESVDCGDRVICEDSEEITSDKDNEGSDNSGNASTGAGNCDPSQAGNICAGKGSEGTLVAHENCNKYYVCANGLPVVQKCPGTLLFDPFKDYCDWPNNVECGDRVICEDSVEDTSNPENGGSNDGGGVGTGAGNCDPSLAGNICAAEGSDGVLVAHENCNKYYICSHGVPVTQRCPGTLLFDPFKDYCDWPDNVDCGDRVISEASEENTNETENGDSDNGGSIGTGAGNCDPSQAGNICATGGSDGVLVAHENCNKYYICSHGVPVTQRCPGTLLFDPFKDYCDWPDNVDCGDRVISEASEENTNETENGDSDNGGSIGTGAGNCDPSQAGNICATGGSDGVLVAHENCNKYYICSHGIPIVQKCPGTLLFDPFKDYCDWPESLDCGDRVISEQDNNDNENQGSSEDGGSGNGDSDNGGPGTCNCNPGEAPAICAADESDNTLIAHENCNQFYICAAGRPVIVTCPGSTLYNPYTVQCDWPENVECGDRVVPEVDSENGGIDNESSENGETDNGGTDNGGSGTCNCNPGEAPAICAADGSDNKLVAHENCNQFYTCAAGQPVTVTCPGSTLYNPYTEQCDWPENVECGERVIPEVDSKEEDNNGNGETDTGSAENGESDNGGTDNGGSGTCNCNPGEAPAICAADESDNTLVAHENCNQFYTCAAGQPVTVTCPGSTLYNPYTEQCDWPENVECGERVISEVDSKEEDNNGNGETDTGSAENGGSDNGGTDNGGSGTCNCNPDEAPAICAADESDNTLVAHENCNQFYTCAAGQPVTVTCPGSTLYNPYTEQCDWPENVECGERVISEVDSKEEDNNGNGETDTGSAENGGSDNGGTDNGGSGTCNCNPGEAPAICAADESDNTLVAHENCNQFYTCAAGQPVTVTCPGSTLYNPYTEQCDWPENVECGERVIPGVDSKEEDNNGNGETDTGSAENGGSDNGGTDNGGSGTCNCNPGEAPAICAADESDNTLVAHENCNQIYTCAAGQPVTITCPGSTLYNPYTEQCDWPENVECGERVIPEVDSKEEDNNGNGETDTGSSENGGSDNGGTDNGGSGTCNCNPGEAPAICAADGSDNKLVAHENCNQFYTCAAGQPVTVTCPGSTLYNPYTEQCDWPENVECGERVIPEVDSKEEDNNGNGETDTGSSENGGSDNGGTDNGGSGTCNCNPGEAPAICAADGSDNKLVAHENCNQFYTCAAGQPVTVTCPGSTLYNPYTEQCDWPENVECGERVIPEVDSKEEDNNGNGETDTGSSENGGSDNGGTDNGGSGTCNCNPGEAPAICAADGSDGTFVAHENCNQFYTCVAGQPATITCPGSTLYNPYTQICDWPENVECGEKVIPEVDSEDDNANGETDTDSSESEGSDNGGADNGGSGTCNCNPGEAPAICAADGSDNKLVAHENCNQFYTCAAGQPVTVTCPGSTLYNPYTEQCDWPENVECGERVIPEVDSKEEDNNGNGETDIGSSESDGSDDDEADNGGSSTCNCNPGEAPAICAADGSDGTFVAHENCNQFYTCVAGQPATITCPGSTLYNPYTQICDWPENVECGERVIPEIDSEDDNANGETDTDSSESGGSDNGGADNGGTGTCNCNPGEAPAICAADGSDGTFVSHENCNQFYTCVAGQPATITCPGSTLYNPYTQICDWPENVECGERVIPEVDSEDDNANGETDTDSSESEGSDNGGADNGGSGTCNCNPGEAPAICAADGSDGTFVAHENCNQFYTCVAGQPATITCPGSTLYNPYTQICDWPENVECGERVIPEVDSEDDNANGETDTDSSESEGSDNGGADNGGTGTCNCNPGEAPAICAADGSDGTFVAHENCNQFYTCVAGQPATITCPGSTLYNPYTQICDWPENVECGERVISEVDSEDDNENGETDTDSSESEGSDNGGADNGGTGTCNCNPGEAPAICAADGSDGTFVAHENCNQFYTCVAGQPATITCPGSTLYNPYTEVCDWPENVECGERVIPEVDCEDGNGNEDTDTESSENEESDNDGADNGGSGTCNCSPGEAPVICAVDGSDGTFVAHENCNQFFTCVAGKPVTQTCPGSTLYNPYAQICDWPDNVNCGDRLIPECEEDSSANEENENTESSSFESADSDNGSSENGDNDGADNGEEENENEGTESDSIENGDSGNGSSENGDSDNGGSDNGKEENEGSESGSIENGISDNGSSENEGSDNGDSGNAEEENENEGTGSESSEDGSSDNDSSETGDNGGDSGTCNCNPDEAPAICAAYGSDGILVTHENCNQFYTCLAGKPVILTCPGTTLYDPYTQRCDWPNNVECGDRIISEDREDDSDSESDSNASENEDSEDEETENETSDTYPGVASAICAAYGSDGIMAAHENCNQFYTCVAGQPITLTCTGTTLYNPDTQRCDWPDNVSCGDRISSENDNTNDNSDNNDENENSENGSDDGTDSEDSEGNGSIDAEVLMTCARPDSEGVFLPHDQCNQFYVCIGSQPVILSCTGNLLYNHEEKRCDWPENVNCESRIIPSESSEVPELEADDVRVVDVQDEDDEETNTEQEDESQFGLEVAVIRCAEGNSAGVMVPHEECHRFYICVAQRPVVFTCTSDNLYDIEMQQCNYPQNVNCGGRLLRTV